MDFSPFPSYYPLLGECFSLDAGGFTYKVCPFKDAKQSDTSLGKFVKLEAGKMMFEKGAKCWNGPMRSLEVSFICGDNSRLVTVAEPETCRYVAELITPAACD